jgi:hypothetical protein
MDFRTVEQCIKVLKESGDQIDTVDITVLAFATC